MFSVPHGHGRGFSRGAFVGCTVCDGLAQSAPPSSLKAAFLYNVARLRLNPHLLSLAKII